ncbi:hypothetical protein HNQ64_002933 [Prosthecobacter dejongeii]|uniref:Uncharacterized protein n=1 Tax=Prosthecobacter dejongeii TaxID=48465 RepID=A0A7W7YMF5_9BACT|nr:hypothetical protein [Prosthecobacter dejongeii]
MPSAPARIVRQYSIHHSPSDASAPARIVRQYSIHHSPSDASAPARIVRQNSIHHSPSDASAPKRPPSIMERTCACPAIAGSRVPTSASSRPRLRDHTPVRPPLHPPPAPEGRKNNSRGCSEARAKPPDGRNNQRCGKRCALEGREKRTRTKTSTPHLHTPPHTPVPEREYPIRLTPPSARGHLPTPVRPTSPHASKARSEEGGGPSYLGRTHHSESDEYGTAADDLTPLSVPPTPLRMGTLRPTLPPFALPPPRRGESQ